MSDYVTLQFSMGGLVSQTLSRSPFDAAHLVLNSDSGFGAIVCGLDRHDKRLPGWGVGGGIMDGRKACGACYLLRDPELPIRGIDAEAYAAPSTPKAGEPDSSCANCGVPCHPSFERAHRDIRGDWTCPNNMSAPSTSKPKESTE